MLKTEWIYKNIHIKNLGLILLTDNVCKSNIEMNDVVFIDDSYKNLVNTNASEKIAFGNHGWNKEWVGERVLDWLEIEYILIKEKNSIINYENKNR